jgi:hypothetical protein
MIQNTIQKSMGKKIILDRIQNTIQKSMGKKIILDRKDFGLTSMSYIFLF